MIGDPRVVPWPDQDAQRYRELGVWQGRTFYDVLVALAQRFGSRTAAVDAHGECTYVELLERSTQLARGLTRLGITRGDNVIVQLPNRREFLEVCFALFRLGAAPIMAQPAHRRFELSHFARTSAAVAHVVVDVHARCDYRALSHEVRSQCPTLRHTIVLGDAAQDTALVSLYDLSGPLPAPPSASEVALLQLSGGSTNVPKLIARTHDDYLYSVRQSVDVCELTEQTRYLVALPVAHNFPLSSPGVLGVLLIGGRVVLAESAAPDVLCDWMERERVTHTALVPALLPPLLSCAARRRSAVSSLQVLQVGGAKLHESLARRVGPELGCRLQQVFGMAEGLVCYTRPGDSLDLTLSTQGRPMSVLDEIRVVDDEDRDVAPGEVGHLITRGPYTIRGYYNAATHNASAFTRDGFYRTGDMVRVLADGSLVVEGRAKDQINRAGEKIAAGEVEALLMAHPRVESAALVGAPDRYLGERSVAFVVADAVDAQTLRSYLQGVGLTTYKVPDQFRFVQTLPKTAVGKVDKRALAQPLQEETAQNVMPIKPLERGL